MINEVRFFQGAIWISSLSHFGQFPAPKLPELPVQEKEKPILQPLKSGPGKIGFFRNLCVYVYTGTVSLMLSIRTSRVVGFNTIFFILCGSSSLTISFVI